MKTKLFLIVFTVLALVVTFGWSTSAALADTPCNPAFVTQSGSVITVKPTGVDDTANLQCAFDAAVASGPGVDVRLRSGTFHTGQIVVNDFHGKFTGAGVNKTTVFNLPNLYVTPVDAFNNPPSAYNPWPALFAFVDGDFAITDLAIHIVGDDLTTGWTVFGISPPIEELALALVITGTHADARIERFLLQGEKMEGSLFGYNVLNGIFYEGNIGEFPPAMSGSYSLSNSTIRTIAFGTPVFNLVDAFVVVSHNRYEDTFFAMDASDVQYSSLEFSNNKVANSVFGFDLWNLLAPQDVGSNFLIRNNVLSGEIGIAFEQTFGEGNQCLILGNNVQNITDLGIFLGTGTTGCTVVGGSNKTNVLDLGSDNVLVGVNNMGAGVGPNIQTLRKLKK